MSIMPCAPQNTEAITFLANCYALGRFGRGSPVAVHSDDAHFDSGVN